MTDRHIPILPLTAEAFSPFGDVIETGVAPSFQFNAGMADRFHDLARTEALDEGRIGISIARARPYALPLELTLMERHPLGSQAFVPLTPDPFLVIVASGEAGAPGPPRAFLTAPGQGVNYLRNIWHGALTPLNRASSFLIVDRIGAGVNLDEHIWPDPWIIGG